MRNTKAIEPYLIDIPKYGDSVTGYISSISQNTELIPFSIKRIFLTYYTPDDVIRGKHAHYSTIQVLLAVAGKIEVSTEMPNGKKKKYILDRPNSGLLLPPHVWHTMKYSHSAVQLVLASTFFDERDYIREYTQFKLIYGNK